MGRPRLLVLDEPSWASLRRWWPRSFAPRAPQPRRGTDDPGREQNVTVALRHADRAVVLENGHSVLTGTAAELRGRDDIKTFYLGLGTAPTHVPA